MNFGLRTKIMGTVSLVIAIMIILAAVSYWATSTLIISADEATARLADANDVKDASIWLTRQYQNQADLIINQDLASIADFENSAKGFENALNRINKIVDTPEEEGWVQEIKTADDQFDDIFKNGIVPEVKYQLENVLRHLDGESDEILGQLEEYAQKISQSLWQEFNEAAQTSNNLELSKRAKDLDNINKLLFWSVKQYQNQADLIINQDLTIIDDFKYSVTQMDKYRDLVGIAVDTPQEKEWFQKIIEADDKWNTLFHDKIVPAVKKELQKDIQRLDGDSDEALAIVEKNVEHLVSSLSAEAGNAVSGYQSTARRVQYLIVIIAIAGTFLGIALGLIITRSITKPINTITAGMREGSNQVAAAAGQVSTASQSLAEGSSEQAASIEETSASMEEMSSMTKKNAENAGHANNLMKEANLVIKTADDSMGKLIVSMQDISKASEETSKIIKTIDEIAFQTNLLALNAAVEAARAGEAGAGFAVVADEVRNLAMRAAAAAKNTAELIEGTVKKVNEGSKLVSSTNEAFGKVAQSAGKVGEIVAEISGASQEQANGIEQVNIAITEMDKVVQQNAANAEESASASEEMSAQAEQLREYVNELVLLISGKKEEEERHVKKSKTLPAVTSGKKMLPAKKPTEVRPEQVIPFDDDFEDF